MNRYKLKHGMIYLLRCKWTLSALLCWPILASAAEFSVSTGLQYTDLMEFDRNNSLLDQETGYLPSVKLAAQWHIVDDALLTMSYALASGDLAYDGQTQSGAVFNTQTQTRFDQAGVSLETPPLLASTVGTQRLLFGYSVHQWQRDIQGKGSVSPLYEAYSWHSVRLGLVHRSPNEGFKASLGVLTTRQDTLSLDIPNLAYGQVDLPAGNGWFADVSYTFAQTGQVKWQVGAEYQYLQHKRSVNSTLYSVTQSDAIGSFSEPKHTLEQLSGFISLVF